jgi:hypothetical protein
VQFETPRPLSESERRILDALLSSPFVGALELRTQVEQAKVVGGCDCGCPTVYLEVPEETPPSPARGVPVSADVAPVGDKLGGGILLFVESGRLSSLELFFYDRAGPGEWPSLDRITIRTSGTSW